MTLEAIFTIMFGCAIFAEFIKKTLNERIDMRVYRVILVVAVLVLAGNAMGMGKSDGTKKEVKSSLSKESAAPAKVEAKAAPVCSTDEKKPCCPAAAKAAAKPEVKAVKAEVKPVKTEVKSTGDELFVTVNGYKITQSIIDAKIKPQVNAQLKRMKDMGRPVTEEMIAEMKAQMFQRMLEPMIIEQLMSEKQKAHKIKVSKKEIQAGIEEFAKVRNIPMDQLESELAKRYGVAVAILSEQVEMGLGFDKVIDAEAKAAGKSVTANDEDVKKFYDENIKQFSSPEQVRASHILVKTEGMDDAGKAAARTKIDGLLKQARNGSDFAAMAKAHSDDPGSKDTGGEYTFPKGRMVPAFEEAAFSIKVGEVSDVVETQFGYHIIKFSEKIAAVTKSFDEVKDAIKMNLEQTSRGTFSREFIEKLKTDATIVWAEGKKPPSSAMPSSARPSATSK